MEHVLRSHSKAFSLNYSLLYNQWFYLGVNKILLQSVTVLHQICSGTGAKTEALGRSYCIVCVIFLCTHAVFPVSTGHGNASHWTCSQQTQVVLVNGSPSYLLMWHLLSRTNICMNTRCFPRKVFGGCRCLPEMQLEKSLSMEIRSAQLCGNCTNPFE